MDTLLVFYNLKRIWMDTLTLKQLTELLNKSTTTDIKVGNIAFRKFRASLVLLLSDIISISVSFAIAVLIRFSFDASATLSDNYMHFAPMVLPFFAIAYYLRGLYPGFGIGVVDELRNLTYSTTIIFTTLGLFTFFLKESQEFSRIVFALTFGLTLMLVPLGRATARKFFASKNWWGVPVVIIGAGNAGESVIKSLLKHQQIGFRPVLAIDDNIDKWGYLHGVPVIGGLNVIPDISSKLKIENAIIAMPKVSVKRQEEIIQKYSQYFDNTTIIPDLFGVTSLWVATRDLGGVLGLEVQHRLIRKSSYIQKRVFDIFVGSFLLALTAPLMMLIALLIKLDSKGKVIFRQQRVGLNNTRFDILKFRTMHTNAEERLKSLLETNPALKEEFDLYHKIKEDPRITKFGLFLRKFSLDELPQFWNVIKGEMSLIGPRSYMPWERIQMHGNDKLIFKVKPGVSGLWQVTDRNQSSFYQRTLTDVYYIRNWSIFLDLYILAKTVSVVLKGSGV